MTVTDPLALDRQVCFALAVTNRAVLGVYRPILEPLGLTHPQYLVMLALWERSPQSAGDIARTLCLDPASATPLLKRLEVRGLLTRRRSEDDERRLVVELTGDGRDLRARAETVPARVVDALGVATDDLERLHDALSVINRHATLADERTEP